MLFPKQYNKIFKLMLKNNPCAKSMVKDFLKAIPSKPFADLNGDDCYFSNGNDFWKAELNIGTDLVELEIVAEDVCLNVSFFPIFVETINNHVEDKIKNKIAEYRAENESFILGTISLKNSNSNISREFEFEYEVFEENGKLFLLSKQSVYENKTVVINQQDFASEVDVKDFAIVAKESNIWDSEYIDGSGQVVGFYNQPSQF